MTASPHSWGNASRALNSLGPELLTMLPLLAMLRLTPAFVLEALLSLEHSAVYERLVELRTLRLVDSVRWPVGGGRPLGLSHLTDLGLAALAIADDREPAADAEYFELHRRRLRALLSGLPEFVATQQLLAVLARRLGPTDLLDWRQPWRGSVVPEGAVTPLRLRLPAYAELSDEREGGLGYLLLPDRGVGPVAAYRGLLTGLLWAQAKVNKALPALIVATESTERADAWRQELEACRSRLGVARVSLCAATWQALADGDVQLPTGRAFEGCRHSGADGRDEPPAKHEAQERIPALIGRPVSRGSRGGKLPETLSMSGLGLRLLEVVGQWAFVTEAEAATLAGADLSVSHTCCEWLRARGLISRLAIGVVPQPLDADSNAKRRSEPDTLWGLELTRAGLKVLAANYLLPPAILVRHLGLAIDFPQRQADEKPRDPDEAKHRRDRLVGQLAHTRGLNAMHVGLVRDAERWRQQAHGRDDALMEWRSEDCSRFDIIKPDAYLVYRHDGRDWGAFVEYDRRTEHGPQLRGKLGRYWRYHDSHGFERDFNGCPALLIVTVDKSAEDCIVELLRTMQPGRSALPVWITNEVRIHGRNKPAGWLDEIWRGSVDGFEERHAWPPRG